MFYKSQLIMYHLQFFYVSKKMKELKWGGSSNKSTLKKNKLLSQCWKNGSNCDVCGTMKNITKQREQFHKHKITLFKAKQFDSLAKYVSHFSVWPNVGPSYHGLHIVITLFTKSKLSVQGNE